MQTPAFEIGTHFMGATARKNVQFSTQNALIAFVRGLFRNAGGGRFYFSEADALFVGGVTCLILGDEGFACEPSRPLPLEWHV